MDSNRMSNPDIFTYIDYRAFLKDAFDALKTGSPRLSFRTFAKKAGFSTPNFLQMIIQGQRNLSSTNVVATARAFKLSKHETDFFQNLVGYDQAKSLDEKNIYYQNILRNNRYASTQTLDKSKYEFLTHWYIPVVRELLVHKGFDGRSAWIAARVFPRITVAQVEAAKTLILKLGLAQFEESTGKWGLVDAVLSTESEVAHLGIRNYHMAAIQLAHDSLKVFGPGERDVRSITIGLSESAYGELKSRMENVWKEVLEFAGTQQEIEKVYQVNFQMFPLTREPSIREGKK